MAPIKFEENIREKLQERELQPSKDAWSKLESRLDKELPEKKGSRGIWLAIAASMTGVLLIVSFFFFRLNGEQPNQLVLDETEIPVLEEVTPNDRIIENELQKSEMEDIAVSEEEKNGAEDMAEDKMQEPVQNKMIAVEETNSNKLDEPLVSNSEEKIIPKQVVEVEEGVAKVENELPNKTNKEIMTPEKKEDMFVDAKVDEVVASIQNIEKNNNTVTAEEIDELLQKAQRDIATQRMLNSDTKKIDATALLRDVETELERSFRDKVFDALGDGYNKIRTAVVQRNN